MEKKKEKTTDNVHENHRQRVMAKYKRSGAEAFDTHQLLELLLFNMLRQVDTNPISHEMLDAFPDIKLIRATPEEMMKVYGVGEKTSYSLREGFDTSVRLICDGLERQTLNSEFKKQLYVYLRCLFKREESVMVWFLTGKMKVVGEMEYTGRMRHPESFSEDIITEAEKYGGKHILLCHTHGENGVEPSVEDLYVTEYMKNRLKESGIELVEHYIVSTTDCAACRSDGEDIM